MSRRGCQRFNKRAAMAPFLDWTSWRSRSDGKSGVYSPSGVLAKSTACLIVWSIFFHLFVRSLGSDGSSSNDEANLDSLAAKESASLLMAEEFGVLASMLCVFGGCFRCNLCKFLHQFIAKLSVAGRLAVCNPSMVS